MSSNPSSPAKRPAGTVYAWYVVLLLMGVQVVSYIDRFLPSLMIAPIKADLNLTDTHVGLLLGPAFGVFYVLVGLPIGWLADRYNRRNILALGIALWSSMTAAGAVARSFLPLFGARLGVGLGEAAVAPCAVSIISDYFSREKRARAISVFMSGTFIGAGSAFLFGGPLVHAIAQLPSIAVPLLGELRPWQLTFLLVGLPGLLVAAMMFTIREPKRTEQVTLAGSKAPSLKRALGYIASRWRAFGTLFVGSACVVTMGSLSFWNVAMFDRTWDWNVRDVGLVTGAMFFTGGPIGTALGVWLTNRWIRAGHKDAVIRTLLAGLLIAVPGFAGYPSAPTPVLAIAFMFLAFVGQACAAAAGPACLSLIAPGQMRAQAVSIYYLVISIAGQLIGPPPVGMMTDAFGDPAMLRYAMTIEALAVGIPAIILVSLGIKHFRRQVVEIEEGLANEGAARG